MRAVTRLVNLEPLVNLEFQGSPPRFTTIKSSRPNMLQRGGEPGEPFSKPKRVYAHVRTRPRTCTLGVAPRFTRFTTKHNPSLHNNLTVVNLVSAKVHHP